MYAAKATRVLQMLPSDNTEDAFAALEYAKEFYGLFYPNAQLYVARVHGPKDSEQKRKRAAIALFDEELRGNMPEETFIILDLAKDMLDYVSGNVPQLATVLDFPADASASERRCANSK